MQIERIYFNDASSAIKKIEQVDAIIDAIFGTGVNREVTGIYKDAINLINKSNKTVFSIDIPSGINGDTGKIMGSAVKATFTFIFPSCAPQ